MRPSIALFSLSLFSSSAIFADWDQYYHVGEAPRRARKIAHCKAQVSNDGFKLEPVKASDKPFPSPEPASPRESIKKLVDDIVGGLRLPGNRIISTQSNFG